MLITKLQLFFFSSNLHPVIPFFDQLSAFRSVEILPAFIPRFHVLLEDNS